MRCQRLGNLEGVRLAYYRADTTDTHGEELPMNRCLERRTFLSLLVGAIALVAPPTIAVEAEDNFIIVQSTTSTRDSGLFDYILPIFTKKTGIEVRVVAVGTGQALKNAENGDGDVVLVHSKPDEEKFVADGWA